MKSRPKGPLDFYIVNCISVLQKQKTIFSCFTDCCHVFARQDRYPGNILSCGIALPWHCLLLCCSSSPYFQFSQNLDRATCTLVTWVLPGTCLTWTDDRQDGGENTLIFFQIKFKFKEVKIYSIFSN